MRRRVGPLFLLAGSLLVLVSLYLPYEALGHGRSAIIDQLNSYAGGASALQGWGTSAGAAAAVFALLLAAGAAVALVRAEAVARIPFGLGALLVTYFGLAAVVGARTRS